MAYMFPQELGRVRSNLCFSLIFIFSFFVSNVQPQVTIGCGNPPVSGALLDLKEKDSDGIETGTKGIIFPRVRLTSLTSLEPLLTSTDATDPTQQKIHRGIMVYNLNASLPLSEGLYCWDGDRWIKIVGTSGVAGARDGNIGIGTVSPDPSAVLDLGATNKGFLPPRVSLTGLNDGITISSPASGLLVFNTSSASGLAANAYYYNSGTAASPIWTMMQPFTPTAGVQVKKILYTGSTADGAKEVVFGRFKFRLNPDSGTTSWPQFALAEDPGSNVTIAFHMGEFWNSKGYDYTSNSSKTFTNSNWSTYQSITTTMNNSERNEFWVAYPGDANIWQVQYVILGTASPYTYAIVASMY